MGNVAYNHDISKFKMYPIYMTEKGAIYREWELGWYSEIYMSKQIFLPAKMHITSDTITSLHDMISADVFTGS